MRYMVVTNINGRWAVKKKYSTRAMKLFLTKAQAITFGTKKLKSGDELSIHNRDGRVERFLKFENV